MAGPSPRPVIPGLLFGFYALLGLAFFFLIPLQAPPLDNFMVDEGYPLYITQAMQHGQLLYQDVWWPYGPVPIFLYAGLAQLFGNTPQVFTAFQWISAWTSLGLAAMAYRRYVSLPALGFVLIVLFTFNAHVLDLLIYHYIELIGVLLLVLEWRPPGERSIARSILFGLVLVLLHFTKFGTQAVAGLALLSVDVLALIPQRGQKTLLRAVIRSWIFILAAYALGVVLATGALLLFLSPQVTLDAVLPLFMRNSYTFVTPSERHPHFMSLQFFLDMQLPGMVGLAALAWVLAVALRPAGPHARDLNPAVATFPFPLLIPPFVYFFSFLLLFRQEFHYYQDIVFAVLGLPLVFCISRYAVQVIVIVLLLRCVVSLPIYWVKHITGLASTGSTVEMDTPAGFRLTASPASKNFHEHLAAVLSQKVAASDRPDDATIALIDGRPGMFYFYPFKVAGRHAYIVPACVRPWEEATETRALLNAAAIAVAWPHGTSTDMPDKQQTRQALGAMLPPGLSDALAGRLVDPVCAGFDVALQEQVWVFSVAPSP